MSLSLIAAGVWVLLAAATAMLPMRLQYPPGLTLLIIAPVIIGAMAWQHGLWIGALGLAGFASMFRNPLRYLWRQARGRGVGGSK